MPGRKAVGLRQRKYTVLLVLLCVALAIETVGARGVERFLSDAVGTVLAVAIWFVVFERQRERTAMAVVLVAALAIRWGGYLAAASLDHASSLESAIRARDASSGHSHSWPPSWNDALTRLLNYAVRSRQQRLRDRQAERLHKQRRRQRDG